MEDFSYEAAKANGERIRGTLQAGSRQEALRALSRQGLRPISLAGGSKKASAASNATGRFRQADLLFFTEDLADLVDAGLQLEPALQIIEKRQEKEVARLAGNLRADIRDGASFAASLRKVGPPFDDLYCSVAEAGEVTGQLPKLLRRHAQYLASQVELRSKVQTALIYPSVLIVSAILLVIFFITYLVPQLKRLFMQTGRSLPLPTQILIGVGDFVIGYWWLLAGITLLGVIGAFLLVQSEAGRKWWHRICLQLPLFGEVLALRLYVQITHTLGSLLESGINLTRSMRLVGRGVSNEHVREKLVNAAVLVDQGAGVSTAMRKTGSLPDTTIDMITVGEQAGELAESMKKVAIRLEKKMDTRIERLTSVVPIIVILVMAVMIGLIAVSIFFAIFDSIRGLRSRV